MTKATNSGQATPSELALSGLKAGSLSFGGTYTAIGFVREDAVVTHRWLRRLPWLRDGRRPDHDGRDLRAGLRNHVALALLAASIAVLIHWKSRMAIGTVIAGAGAIAAAAQVFS